MKKLIVLFLAFMLLALSGCFVDKKVEGYSQHRIIVTPRGNEVILKGDVETYAVLNQSYAETLVDLGFENDIVVLNKESLYLGEFRNVISVFDSNKPDIASLISAQPDVIIVDNATLKKLDNTQMDKLNNSGIPLIVLEIPGSIEEVRMELQFLIDLVDAQYGDLMLKDFNEKLLHIEELQKERNTYIQAYMQLSEENNEVTTVGGWTFYGDALKKAGVASVFEDEAGIVKTTKEEVAKKNPKVIIVVSTDETAGNNIINNPLYENIEAVQSGKIIVLNKFNVMNPNYKCLDWILTLNQKLYE